MLETGTTIIEKPNFVEVLSRFGASLTVYDGERPVVQEHLAHLNLLPAGLVKTLVGRDLKVVVGESDILGLVRKTEALKHLLIIMLCGDPWKGPNGQGLAGLYFAPSRTVLAGNMQHGSFSLVLHEYGHGFGDLLDFNDSTEAAEAHVRLFSKLRAYDQQGGPGGQPGIKEFLAESFAGYFRLSKEDFIKRYDEAWRTFLEQQISKHSSQ